MADIMRVKSDLERAAYSTQPQYESFRKEGFMIIDGLPLGKHMEFVVKEPTLIRQSTGEIKVTSFAPTIILGGTNNITLDAHAPVGVNGSTGVLNAYLRKNSYIKGQTNQINIVAAGNLELIALDVQRFNGVFMQWRPVHVNAPNGNTGFIELIGSTGNLSFQYENLARFEILNDSEKELLQRLKELA